jgi:hypothetical protein
MGTREKVVVPGAAADSKAKHLLYASLQRVAGVYGEGDRAVIAGRGMMIEAKSPELRGRLPDADKVESRGTRRQTQACSAAAATSGLDYYIYKTWVLNIEY